MPHEIGYRARLAKRDDGVIKMMARSRKLRKPVGGHRTKVLGEVPTSVRCPRTTGPLSWLPTPIKELDMAKPGDVIEHPVTGERFTFLKTARDTDGEYSRYEVRVRPHGFVATPHVHPRVEETFEIRSGAFTFVVAGEKREIGPGEGATVPVGTPHAWWNAGEEEGLAMVEFRPALNADEFFETFFGLAQDGKVSPKTGLPNLLWLAVILRTYRDFLYIASPPLPLQSAVFVPLAAVARVLGYRAPYPYPYSRSRTTEMQGSGSRR